MRARKRCRFTDQRPGLRVGRRPWSRSAPPQRRGGRPPLSLLGCQLRVREVPSRSRQAMSASAKKPRTVGRSWVEMVASAGPGRRPAPGRGRPASARTRAPSRRGCRTGRCAGGSRRARCRGPRRSPGSRARATCRPPPSAPRRTGSADRRRRRGAARRDQEQAQQPEHMVDAQGTGIAHRGPQGGQGGGPFSRSASGRERHQVPVLPQRAQRVGRRTDRGPRHHRSGRDPRLGTVRHHADREIAIEADPHAGRARPRCAAASCRSASHCRKARKATSSAWAAAKRSTAAEAATSRPSAKPTRATGRWSPPDEGRSHRSGNAARGPGPVGRARRRRRRPRHWASLRDGPPRTRARGFSGPPSWPAGPRDSSRGPVTGRWPERRPEPRASRSAAAMSTAISMMLSQRRLDGA